MHTPFTAAPHHDVLLLLVQLTVLLLSARLLAELAQRLGQPSVVGEILAGIVLGPSLLSGLVPAVGAWIVPHSDLGGYLLETVSLVGALFLLVITGLETDLGLIRQHARTAIGVSFGGILLTFSTGYVLGRFLPSELLAHPGTEGRLVFSLFVATAMSISAIPVIAKVLMDLDLMRRDIGQTIIAAGMSDDTTGWILLSIVTALAASGRVSAASVLGSIARVLGFMVVSFTVGRWLVRRALDFVQDELKSPDRMVTLVVVLCVVWAAVTQGLGLEAVLGAFVMGILFGQMPRLPAAVHHQLTTTSRAVFTPIFFAVAGLKVNIRPLLEPRLALIALLVIAVAAGGKIAGTYLGARLIGRREHWTALSFGATLLGAFTGRKVASASTINKASSAFRGVGRSMQEQSDIGRAKDSMQVYQQQLDQLNADFKTESDALESRIDPATETLENLSINPKKTDINVQLVALVWVPFRADAQGQSTPAW